MREFIRSCSIRNNKKISSIIYGIFIRGRTRKSDAIEMIFKMIFSFSRLSSMFVGLKEVNIEEYSGTFPT